MRGSHRTLSAFLSQAHCLQPLCQVSPSCLGWPSGPVQQTETQRSEFKLNRVSPSGQKHPSMKPVQAWFWFPFFPGIFVHTLHCILHCMFVQQLVHKPCRSCFLDICCIFTQSVCSIPPGYADRCFSTHLGVRLHTETTEVGFVLVANIKFTGLIKW